MKAALFIDAPSLWFQARRYGEMTGRGQMKVDYSTLKRHLSNGHDVISCCVYVAARPGIDPFVRALQHLGYTVIMVDTGDMALDLQVARDADDSADAWDVAVIATGEGRYSDLFRRLRANGKQVEIHAFPIDCPIRDLSNEVDKYLPLVDGVLRSESVR